MATRSRGAVRAGAGGRWAVLGARVRPRDLGPGLNAMSVASEELRAGWMAEGGVSEFYQVEVRRW